MLRIRQTTILASRVGRPRRRILLVACLFAVLLIPAARATPGTLDPSFGTGGTVTTAIGPGNDVGLAAVIQPDGKILAAGYSSNGTSEDFALARYNADGSLDTSFGSGGKVTTSFGSGDDDASTIALQSDGKIVLGGYTTVGARAEFALARYNSNGSLDPTFGSGGEVTTPVGSDDYVASVALQPDGKIVAAGSSSNGSNYDFALARYNPDGSLDTTFNGGGTATTAFGAGGDTAYGVAIQPDGKIVAGGDGWTGSKFDFALARFDTNGSLDSSFGSGGKVTTPIGSGADVPLAGVALQPDGKIVAAGYTTKVGGEDFALARYNADGSLDSGFGTGGKVTTAIGQHNAVLDLALQPDGRIVAGGYSWDSPTIASEDFAVLRLNADGTLDSSFGSGGKIRTSIGSNEDVGSAVKLQGDGKIVVAGYSSNGANDDFALVRYVGSTLTVAKTGSGSGSVSSDPGGIDCGATCSAGFAAGPVTLTASPAAGSSFVGWSGACSGTGACTVSMSGDQAVTARFESDQALTVTTAGSGAGTVSSAPAGISCGSSCAHAFTYGASVTLTAAASAGSRFAGWSGACSGTASCTVDMSVARSVTATFTRLCVVPKLKGKTLSRAKATLSHADCSLGKVRKAYSARVKRGRVVAQRPKPGSELDAGAKVRLTLSKGKKP
jgi:uncharacterized delta-60 repeat protein